MADPFFSLWPGIALVALIMLNRYHPKRRFWWRFGVFLPALYLGYCTFNKVKIQSEVKEILVEEQIPHKRFFTTPAPLQNWLWYVVSGNDSGYYVGFHSLFDKEKNIRFQYFLRNDSLLRGVAHHEELQKLIRFSGKFYTVEKWGDTLVFNDLRFGQILGWEQPRGRFVFHYFLQRPDDNDLVVQRGRFAGWNRDVLKRFLIRIRGE